MVVGEGDINKICFKEIEKSFVQLDTVQNRPNLRNKLRLVADLMGKTSGQNSFAPKFGKRVTEGRNPQKLFFFLSQSIDSPMGVLTFQPRHPFPLKASKIKLFDRFYLFFQFKNF